jgi:uncharacterized RDD family membrane protein YckC
LQQIVQSGESIQQPENFQQIPVQIKYAGFWIRYAAYIIDSMIISMIILILICLLSFSYMLINPASRSEATPPPIMYFSAIILAYGYFIISTKKYHATLGKKAFGIIVLRSDFNEASWGKIILRETVGKIVSYIIFYIGYIMAGFTQKKQALHDIIADTVVIYKDPNKKTKTWLTVLVVFIPFIIVAIILVFTTILAGKASINLQENSQQNLMNSQKQYELQMKNNLSVPIPQ